jgi:hypothetical protein
MIPENIKKRIDSMSYYQLLDHWRFASAGDPMFQGEIGKYYSKVISEKKNADPAGAVADSKALGWK